MGILEEINGGRTICWYHWACCCGVVVYEPHGGMIIFPKCQLEHPYIHTSILNTFWTLFNLGFLSNLVVLENCWDTIIPLEIPVEIRVDHCVSKCWNKLLLVRLIVGSPPLKKRAGWLSFYSSSRLLSPGRTTDGSVGRWCQQL